MLRSKKMRFSFRRYHIIFGLSVLVIVNLVIYFVQHQRAQASKAGNKSRELDYRIKLFRPFKRESQRKANSQIKTKKRNLIYGGNYTLKHTPVNFNNLTLEKLSEVFKQREQLGALEHSRAGKLCKNALQSSVWVDKDEIKKVQLQLIEERISDGEFVTLTSNCSKFLSRHGYTNIPLRKVEEDFPIAFAIIMYRSAAQVEQLLRTIYRPHNYYCIHVDKKAYDAVRVAMESIAACFDNVFIVPSAVKITWCSIEVLHAEQLCMNLLLERGHNWKYYINLAGQDFPLKTNFEIVQILKLFEGKNDVASFQDDRHVSRQQYAFRQVNDKLEASNILKAPPPDNITISKGELHVSLSRGFVDFVLKSEIAKILYDWLRDTECPDEHFYQTLNRLPGTPGGFTHNAMTISRAKIWNKANTCHGKTIRGVCVFGAGDLPWLIKQPHLFANKFNIDRDPLPTYCLERYLKEKSRYPRPINLNVYRQFVFKRLIDSNTMKWTAAGTL
ncbi:beta-1,3-galactosyl-O-glycosyl-glycoprotein beta-1,6-N-acetylglucosaminyltransferase-like [Ptychodera flava]|uniref:beta-1,3-galactosyl-O-glycosyl-glycoprotein beta-1,6-N-acetylglucosaminyltransferase-like n=1 Tax=Ptychodera flava TaxID=63121 RepID=UPI00396A0EA1